MQLRQTSPAVLLAWWLLQITPHQHTLTSDLSDDCAAVDPGVKGAHTEEVHLRRSQVMVTM